MKHARRDFLKATSALGLAWLSRGCTHLSGSRRIERVLVIGAGISGLAAARKLAEAGCDVEVLEARDRIGGRICTKQDFLGGPVDLGASWIHGIKENPLFELAKQNHITTTSTFDDEYPATFDARGGRFSEKALSSAYAHYKTVKKSALHSSRASLGDAFEDSLKGLKTSKAMTMTDELLVRHLIEANVEGAYATDVKTLAVDSWDTGHWFEGEDHILPGGYSQFVEVLAKGLKIKLGSVVQTISHDTSGVKVTTGAGGIFSADRVVVTLPLGVLKRDDVTFSPALPESKKKAIAGLGFGLLDKVYLGYSEAFWPKDTWIEYVAPRPAAWPTFFNMHRYTRKPVLVAFVTGSFARDMEKRSDDAVVAEVRDVLSRIARKNRWPEKEPLATVVTRWGADPFARGSYSFVAPGMSLEDFDRVGAPVADRVYFAGEATNSKNYMTAHAAFLSGLHAADAILSASLAEATATVEEVFHAAVDSYRRTSRIPSFFNLVNVDQ